MDTIQFSCPACGVQLRVPSAAAGFQGPCPKCGQEIVGPIPSRGIESRIAKDDPFAPFPGNAPAKRELPEPPAPEPEPTVPEDEPFVPEPKAEPAPENPFAKPLPSWEETQQVPTDIPSTAEPSEPTEPSKAKEEPTEPFPSQPPLTDPPEEPAPQASTPLPSPKPSQPERKRMSDVLLAETPVIRRLRIIVLILACAMCSVVCFILGYLTAMKNQEISEPIYISDFAGVGEPDAHEEIAAPEASKEPDEELPIIDVQLEPDKAPTIEPLVDPETGNEPPLETPVPEDDPENEAPNEAEEAATSEESDKVELSGTPDETRPASLDILETFLEATDWQTRKAHILQADEADAGMIGSQAIATTSITHGFSLPDLDYYVVTTEELPDGFPVTMHKKDDQWLVDWNTFVEFHQDHFRKFASGQLGNNATLHLFVRPDQKWEHMTFKRYHMSAPITGREYAAFTKKGSLGEAKLSSLMESDELLNDPDSKKPLKEKGIPLIVSLQYQKNKSGQPFLLIENLVARGWGPEN